MLYTEVTDQKDSFFVCLFLVFVCLFFVCLLNLLSSFLLLSLCVCTRRYVVCVCIWVSLLVLVLYARAHARARVCVCVCVWFYCFLFVCIHGRLCQSACTHIYACACNVDLTNTSLLIIRLPKVHPCKTVSRTTRYYQRFDDFDLSAFWHAWWPWPFQQSFPFSSSLVAASPSPSPIVTMGIDPASPLDPTAAPSVLGGRLLLGWAAEAESGHVERAWPGWGVSQSLKTSHRWLVRSAAASGPQWSAMTASSSRPSIPRLCRKWSKWAERCWGSFSDWLMTDR